ncbi:MAG: hypothetical protein LUG19_11175 [Desulfovibrio sp.]|nr:hypothetical protein [Desulfovibrio sp.]MCD7984791.1 hypothetical protein [Desulfovibrio sp.]
MASVFPAVRAQQQGNPRFFSTRAAQLLKIEYLQRQIALDIPPQQCCDTLAGGVMARTASRTEGLLSIADISRHFSLPESTTRYYCKRFAPRRLARGFFRKYAACYHRLFEVCLENRLGDLRLPLLRFVAHGVCFSSRPGSTAR